MTVSHTGNPTDETWDDLLVQYGWNEKLQDELEHDLALVTSPSTCLDSEILKLLIDIDCGRKDVRFEKSPDSDSLDPSYPAPPKDLTRFGIAPHPGPNATRRSRAQQGRRRNGVQPAPRPARQAVTVMVPTYQPTMPAARPRQPRAARAGQATTFGGQAAPAAYATTLRSGKPLFLRASYDRSRIRHRELLSAVAGTTTFTANAFSVNPGIAATFPWLSTQAVGWEKYRFTRLAFCYYTRAPTSTQGSILLAPDYDAADAAPATETIAASYNGAVEDAVWKDTCCELDPKLFRELFIRTTTLAANLDIKTYDTATFFMCTTDATAASPIGKLWVEYDVELINPQLPA